MTREEAASIIEERVRVTEYVESSYVDCVDIEALRIAIKALTQPEPHWIPCSERMPEDGTECLVSVRCSKKVVVVDMATYSTDLFKVDKEDFFGNRGESGWYYLSNEYGYCKVLNVIAWMPLPEPMKEGES